MAADQEKVELIIDTDVGIDDATAILVTLQHPKAIVKARFLCELMYFIAYILTSF